MTASQNMSKIKRKTGPKTQRGKRHSSRNALRHGLSTPIECEPQYSTLIEPLSRAILGRDGNVTHLTQARKVAQALLEIDRLRRFSEPVGHQAKSAIRQSSGESTRSQVTPEQIARYLSRAYGRLRSSIRHLDEAQWRAHTPLYLGSDGFVPIYLDLND